MAAEIEIDRAFDDPEKRASMRPRRMAAEIRLDARIALGRARASMRPRRMAAEIQWRAAPSSSVSRLQ